MCRAGRCGERDKAVESAGGRRGRNEGKRLWHKRLRQARHGVWDGGRKGVNGGKVLEIVEGFWGCFGGNGTEIPGLGVREVCSEKGLD